MSLLHERNRPELEDGVRTMLHRLAEGASERPPAWEDLIAPRDAVVVPLGGPESTTEARVHRLGPERRPRLRFAAAAVLLLAAAGVLVVGRTASETTGGPAAGTISVISPGDPAFDAGAATAFWASDATDPATAALAYLEAMGVPIDPAGAPAVAVRTATDAIAVVDWSLPAAAGGSGGTVYLRPTSTAGEPPIWAVVGAAAPDVALADVRYDGADLTFSVARASADAEQLAVSAWIDGQPVSLGGDPVAQAGAADVSLGELLDLGPVGGADDTLRLPVEADDVVSVRVVRVVEGLVHSVTQMAIALPDADPVGIAAAGPPSVGARGGATGQAEAGTSSASTSAGAEAGGGGPDGTAVVPGVTEPPLPELPPLPLPGGTGIPAPTVPVPPATVPGSPSDLLP